MILIEIDNSTTDIKNFRLQEIVEQSVWKLIDIEKEEQYTIIHNPRIVDKESKHMEWIEGGMGEEICLLLSRVSLSPYKQDT